MSNRLYSVQMLPGDSDLLHGQLLYVTSARYDTDWNSIPHTHYFTELFFVRKGKGYFQMDSETFDVQTDDLILISPNIAHTEHSSSSEPLEYIVLGVEGLTFTHPDGSPMTYGRVNCRNDHSSIRFYLDIMVREMQQNKDYRDLLCQNLLNVILIYLLRHEKLQITITPQFKASKEISAVKEYIDQYFKTFLNLDILADAAHLNKYYMVHHFTQTYGISPIHYLLQKRLEESKFLLRSTDYSISQIAEITGFSSISYFSQRFKGSIGMTPQQYRKQLTQSESAIFHGA